MGDCPTNMQLDHTKQLATLRSDVDNLENRVDDLSDIKNAIVRLTVLQEEQIKLNKEVSNTLKEMNEEIKTTRDEVKEIKVEVQDTKVEVKNTTNKVNGLEEQIINIDNKSKIDLLELFKQYAIPVVMGGGIVYFILQIVGMI